MQLDARVDAELGEDLVQVVFDGARADEQPCADLWVGQAVAGKPGDLGLLGCELAAGFGGAFAGSLPGGQQLASGALGESLGAHRDEHLVGGAQLFAGLGAPVLAS